MDSDSQLRKHVEEELSWQPGIDEAAIGVSVNDAIVTLSGHVASFAEKFAAERTVLRIRGVRAVVSELTVLLPGHHQRNDEDIARAASDALRWNTALPKDEIKVKVSGGYLTLSGTVEWNYQRETARRLVSHLIGVKGVINEIEIKPRHLPTSAEVKSGIEAALKRSAEVEAGRIRVETRGSEVVLAGTVDSWPERAAAERAAWASPGVSSVRNDIHIGTLMTSGAR